MKNIYNQRIIIIILIFFLSHFFFIFHKTFIQEISLAKHVTMILLIINVIKIKILYLQVKLSSHISK